jgi:hypothetical protein
MAKEYSIATNNSRRTQYPARVRYNRKVDFQGMGNIESIIHVVTETSLQDSRKAYRQGLFEFAIKKHPAPHDTLDRWGKEFFSKRYYLLAMMAFDMNQNTEWLIKTGYALLEYDNLWLSREAFIKADHRKGIEDTLKRARHLREKGVMKEIEEYLDKHRESSKAD